ncbi:DUF2199 domain-containing protein [Denitrobaculum tricleocarpae]|uniref:DUF2199 domain-containing protein n=1 Tax=Denitrobaculum tricleocarpae TaxID=2591009 RepID=A0A545T3Y2_9PROT|nr:DUF2199 domain-containing protein [Denitrobaculum tricleocarpae]TQV71926.1 DUF2199 domain-containing protein [Denitrobaculum tricleocarpae]
MALSWLTAGSDPFKPFEFQCDLCGDLHKGSPSFANDAPYSYYRLTKSERTTQAQLTEDTCVINGESFFIRATLEIPIDDAEDPFCWGVWVSQSEKSFNRYIDTFHENQAEDGSFGWLAVTMPGYKRTGEGEPLEHLACNVEWQDKGTRPLVFPHECDHPLYGDVVDGISWDRAVELAKQILHP